MEARVASGGRSREGGSRWGAHGVRLSAFPLDVDISTEVVDELGQASSREKDGPSPTGLAWLGSFLLLFFFCKEKKERKGKKEGSFANDFWVTFLNDDLDYLPKCTNLVFSKSLNLDRI